jgi:hypothetical protein
MTELNIPDGTNYQYYQCFVNSFNNIICNKIDNKYTYINGSRLITVKKIIPEYLHKYFIKYKMAPNDITIK